MDVKEVGRQEGNDERWKEGESYVKNEGRSKEWTEGYFFSPVRHPLRMD